MSTKPSRARRLSVAAAWMTRTEKARTSSPLLVLHGYCRGADCPAREVTVTVKDFDGDLLARMQHHGVRCPICGHGLVCHSVVTADEQARVDDQDARCNVNMQRYERDHGSIMPFSVIEDDRLPAEHYVARDKDGLDLRYLVDAADVAAEGRRLAAERDDDDDDDLPF